MDRHWLLEEWQKPNFIIQTIIGNTKHPPRLDNVISFPLYFPMYRFCFANQYLHGFKTVESKTAYAEGLEMTQQNYTSIYLEQGDFLWFDNAFSVY
jgi:hypothetical protein